MQSVKTEDCGAVRTYCDDTGVCSSSDDRNDYSLPPIHSFTTLSSQSETEDRPTSSTRDVVSLLGKRRPIKIHIGWMHKVGDKYRQVRRKYGGGTRELILDNLNIYPAEIVQKAVTLFFPEGSSQVVTIDDVESFALGNFCGEELTRFSDERGEECSLGQYLKAQGTYASRCYIYLLTKKKTSGTSTGRFGCETFTRRRRAPRGRYADHRAGAVFRVPNESMFYYESAYIRPENPSYIHSGHVQQALDSSATRLLPTDKLGFVMEGRPVIEVRYSFASDSIFANIAGHEMEFTRKDCLEFTLFRYPLVDISEFQPTNNGFVVKSIKINDSYLIQSALDESRWMSFVFPEAAEHEGLVLHSPTEVWGYDGEELVIGVIAGCHGVRKAFYSWYRNEAMYLEGINLCCITVSLPGVYFCQVSFDDCYDISQPLQIVEFADCSFKTAKLEPKCVDVNYNCCHVPSNVPSRIIPSVDEGNLDVDFSTKVCTGTYGTVYKASWLGTNVHVEFLNLDEVGTEKGNFVCSLRDVNSRIRHPNILSLMACVENPSHVLMLSEYHEGATLESLIFSAETKQYLTLNILHKQNIAIQTCQALVYLHALSPPIMHRAIHPASVWVLNNGSVAKLSSPNVKRNGPGLPHSLYLAPECLTSFQDSDLAADVWGVGATLTVMLTEETLWGNLSHTDSPIDFVIDLLEHGNGPPAVQSLTIWREILNACLNIDPSLRPSVMQLLSHLRA